jgi:hypothetical protein
MLRKLITWHTIIGCWIPNNNEIHLTGKASLEKINTSRFGP